MGGILVVTRLVQSAVPVATALAKLGDSAGTRQAVLVYGVPLVLAAGPSFAFPIRAASQVPASCPPPMV
jgi:hypothetical protein